MEQRSSRITCFHETRDLNRFHFQEQKKFTEFQRLSRIHQKGIFYLIVCHFLCRIPGLMRMLFARAKRNLHDSRRRRISFSYVASGERGKTSGRPFLRVSLTKDKQCEYLPWQDMANCPWRDCRESPINDGRPPTLNPAIPLRK